MPSIDRLVLDSSVTLAWCFTDENDPHADQILLKYRSLEMLVPTLWRLEVANVFVLGERRKRSTRADTETWKASLATLPIVLAPETSEHALNETLNLARLHNLTVYDAA